MISFQEIKPIKIISTNSFTSFQILQTISRFGLGKKLKSYKSITLGVPSTACCLEWENIYEYEYKLFFMFINNCYNVIEVV